MFLRISLFFALTVFFNLACCLSQSLSTLPVKEISKQITGDELGNKAIQVAIEESTGRKVFLWHKTESPSTVNKDIYIQVLDRDNNPIAGYPNPVKINEYIWRDQTDAKIVMNQSDGSFIIVWTSNYFGTYDIFAKKLRFSNLLGDAISPDILISTGSHQPLNQTQPLVDIDYFKNELVIAWRSDSYTAGAGVDIYARTIKYDFSIFGDIFMVNDVGDISYAQILRDLKVSPFNGNVFFLYQQNGPSDPADVFIKMMNIPAAGLPITAVPGKIPVNNHTTNEESFGSISINKYNGDVAVSFMARNRDGYSGRGVYAKIFNYNAVVKVNDFRVNTVFVNNKRFNPKVFYDYANNSSRGLVFIYQNTDDATEFTTLKYIIYDDTYQPVGVEEDAVQGLNINNETLYSFAYSSLDNKVIISYEIVSEYNGADKTGWFSQFSTAKASTGALVPENCNNLSENRQITGHEVFGKRIEVAIEEETGRKVFVWHKQVTTNGSHRDIYMQILDKDNNALTTPLRVNSIIASDQENPKVVVNQKDGSFVVAWQGRNSTNDYDIYAKKISFNSLYEDLLTGDLLVNGGQLGFQGNVCMDIDYFTGELVLAWRDAVNDGDGLGIFGRRVKYSDMSFIGNMFRLNDEIVSDQIINDLKISPVTGELFVIYECRYLDYRVYEIMLRKFSRNGSGEFNGHPQVLVNSRSGHDQWDASITFNTKTGDYVVPYTSNGMDGWWGRGAYAKIYDKEGLLIKDEFRVNPDFAESSRFKVKAVWEKNSNTLVFFYQVDEGPVRYSVKYCIYNDEYSPVGGEQDALDGLDIIFRDGNLCAVLDGSRKTISLVYEIFSSPTSSNRRGFYREFLLNHPDLTGSVPLIDEVSTGDVSRNWNHSVDYDENGNVIAESRIYLDAFGRALQIQERNVVENKILTRANIYDYDGRLAVTTLPAPLSGSSFSYNPDFIKSSQGRYAPDDFDEEIGLSSVTINNPSPVILDCDLGRYYNKLNSSPLESFNAVSNYPFFLIDYNDKAWGRFTRVSGPEDNLRMGSGHEKASISMPVLWELDHYLALRNYYIGNSATPATLAFQAIKSISIDENGIETVVFSDFQGNTLATAMVGVDSESELRSIGNNYVSFSSYIDIHVPKGTASSVELNGGSYKIVDLRDGNEISLSALQGRSSSAYYRIVHTGGASTAISIRYALNYYDFSYYYYDDAGRMVASLTPRAVDLGSVLEPEMVSRYEYNSLGWLITENTPDEGRVEYVYRKDGKIRFSQHEEQDFPTTPGSNVISRASFSCYDEFGRTTAMGEYILQETGGTSYVWEDQRECENSTNASGIHTIIENIGLEGLVNGDRLKDVTQIYYDTQVSGSGRVQKNVSGMISKTQRKSWLSNTNADSETWYSYDTEENIEWTAQSLPGLGIKTIDYTYDLFGVIQNVIYQKDDNQTEALNERFEQRFVYDPALRLKRVSTRKGKTSGLAEQAEYKYYLHGPLKRMEIGQNLQGVDYLYTVNGWLKSINFPNTNFDPGNDQSSSSPFSEDLFATTLEYYEDDYQIAGNSGFQYKNTDELYLISNAPQYNGNIRSTVYRGGDYQSSSLLGQYVYQYDRKYQLKSADYGLHGYSGASSPGYFTLMPGILSESEIDYSSNGNMIQLKRRDAGGQLSNKTSYSYHENTNRLSFVRNPWVWTGSGYTGDMYPTRNFVYNKRGQLTAEYTFDYGQFLPQSVRGSYSYDSYGNVLGIYKDAYKNQPVTTYSYNEYGLKTCKTTYNASYVPVRHTYYVYDVAGNIMAVYEKPVENPSASLKELPVYGIDRVGILSLQGAPEYQYELKDHLGNVRVVFIKNGSGTAQVLHWVNYYPYGSIAAGSYSGPKYRYGYQGEWAEDETDNNGYNNFELRMYDPNLGLWFAPDPYRQVYSPYSAMGNNPINFVDPSGGIFGTPLTLWQWMKVNIFKSGVMSASGNYTTPLKHSLLATGSNASTAVMASTSALRNIATPERRYGENAVGKTMNKGATTVAHSEESSMELRRRRVNTANNAVTFNINSGMFSNNNWAQMNALDQLARELLRKQGRLMPGLQFAVDPVELNNPTSVNSALLTLRILRLKNALIQRGVPSHEINFNDVTPTQAAPGLYFRVFHFNSP